MSFVASQSPLSNVKVLQAASLTIAAVDATTAGTVYSYTFPNGTKQFDVVSSVGGTLKIGVSEAAILTGNWFPVHRGNAYHEDSLTLTSFTLYFTSDKPNDIIRIKSWA